MPYQQTLATIREWKRGRFVVRVTAETEYDPDYSFDEDGTIREALDSCNMEVFCVHAACYLDGALMAEDYLGNCFHRKHRDFMDHFGLREQTRKASAEAGHPVCVGSYFSDMVRTVIRDARKAILNIQPVYIRKSAV